MRAILRWIMPLAAYLCVGTVISGVFAAGARIGSGRLGASGGAWV